MYDERFARQYHDGLPPEFPQTSPFTGTVHHLSGPNAYASTQTCSKRFAGNSGYELFNYIYCALCDREGELAHTLDSLVRVSRRAGHTYGSTYINTAHCLREISSRHINNISSRQHLCMHLETWCSLRGGWPDVSELCTRQHAHPASQPQYCILLSGQSRCLPSIVVCWPSRSQKQLSNSRPCSNVQRMVCVSPTSNTVTNSCQVHILLQAPCRPGVSSNVLSMNGSCSAFLLQQTKSQAVVNCPHMLNVPCRQGVSNNAQSMNSVCVACHLHQTRSQALVKCPYMLQVPCRPRVSSSVQSMNNVCFLLGC